MLEGQKVIAAGEMARIEKLAYAEGASEVEFMEKAGEGIAKAAEDFIASHNLDKQVVLLAGKGNNGGDAYVAGRHLVSKGFSVIAFHLDPLDSCGPLCKKQSEQFKSAGGKCHLIEKGKEIPFPKSGIILDGIVGTGFKGKAEGVMAHAIEQANHSCLPILAIDIPSGVNGNTGAVEGVAIQAEQTIYLGLPKLGFYIGEGWNHVGELVHVDFGLAQKFVEQAEGKAYLLDEENLHCLFPPLKRNRHKYDAGYVLAVAGSSGLGGAALLSSFAALRSGAGIIRLFYPEEMEEELGRAPLELVKEAWDFQNFARIYKECKRARSMLIGPGLGRSKETEKMLKKLLANLPLPCVIDADALFFLSKHLSWELPEHTILTPHRKEMERLLAFKSNSYMDDISFHTLCQKFAEQKKVTIVLKGGPTFVFHPGTLPMIITRGTPGLATAGTGDVLTGVIAALLAQRMDARSAAIAGSALHGMAGEIASFQKTPYCMVASDVIDNLPEAFYQVFSNL